MGTRTRTGPWAAALIAMLLVVACGGEPADEAEPEPVDEPTPPAAGPEEAAQTAGEVELATADTDLGTVLVDGEGWTVYLFTEDSEQTSTCTDDCAATWPPVAVAGEDPAVGGDVDENLVSTIERDDGTRQITYAGWPLYRFAGDSGTGDTAGQEVGGVWFAVDPQGEAIR